MVYACFNPIALCQDYAETKKKNVKMKKYVNGSRANRENEGYSTSSLTS